MTRVEIILGIVAVWNIGLYYWTKELTSSVRHIEEILEDETEIGFGGVKVVLDKEKWKKIDDEWYYILDWMGIHAFENCYVVCDKDFEVEEIETCENALAFYCKEKPKKDIEIEICIG